MLMPMATRARKGPRGVALLACDLLYGMLRVEPYTAIGLEGGASALTDGSCRLRRVAMLQYQTTRVSLCALSVGCALSVFLVPSCSPSGGCQPSLTWPSCGSQPGPRGGALSALAASVVPASLSSAGSARSPGASCGWRSSTAAWGWAPLDRRAPGAPPPGARRRLLARWGPSRRQMSHTRTRACQADNGGPPTRRGKPATAATGLARCGASKPREAVLTTDTRLTVTFCNQAAENLTGWQAVDAHGRPLTAILHLLDEPTRQPMTVPLTRWCSRAS